MYSVCETKIITKFRPQLHKHYQTLIQITNFVMLSSLLMTLYVTYKG